MACIPGKFNIRHIILEEIQYTDRQIQQNSKIDQTSLSFWTRKNGLTKANIKMIISLVIYRLRLKENDEKAQNFKFINGVLKNLNPIP